MCAKVITRHDFAAETGPLGPRPPPGAEHLQKSQVEAGVQVATWSSGYSGLWSKPLGLRQREGVQPGPVTVGDRPVTTPLSREPPTDRAASHTVVTPRPRKERWEPSCSAASGISSLALKRA